MHSNALNEQDLNSTGIHAHLQSALIMPLVIQTQIDSFKSVLIILPDNPINLFPLNSVGINGLGKRSMLFNLEAGSEIEAISAQQVHVAQITDIEAGCDISAVSASQIHTGVVDGISATSQIEGPLSAIQTHVGKAENILVITMIDKLFATKITGGCLFVKLTESNGLVHRLSLEGISDKDD